MADETNDQGFGASDKGQDPPPDNSEAEQKARNMGWQPKEQWKGNPDNWVAADEFVKRGDTFVPFLQHDRKRLKTELDARDVRINQMERDLKATKDSLAAVTEFNENMAKERQTRRKAEIGAELKTAREAGDDVRVAELQNELGEVIKPPEKSNGNPPPEQRQQQPAIQPWVKEFIDTNDDFFKNQRKIALFNAIMMEKRQGGD